MKSKDKERQYESKEVWFRVVPNAECGGLKWANFIYIK